MFLNVSLIIKFFSGLLKLGRFLRRDSTKAKNRSSNNLRETRNFEIAIGSFIIDDVKMKMKGFDTIYYFDKGTWCCNEKQRLQTYVFESLWLFYDRLLALATQSFLLLFLVGLLGVKQQEEPTTKMDGRKIRKGAITEYY